jgi:hypothetical protein
VRCGTIGAAIAATLLLRCYCCSDGVVTLWLKFLFFFLFDNFKRENESEKKKKERDSKPISWLYWLA